MGIDQVGTIGAPVEWISYRTFRVSVARAQRRGRPVNVPERAGVARRLTRSRRLTR